MKKVTLLIAVFTASFLYLKAQDSLQQYTAKYKFPAGAVVTDVTVMLDSASNTLSITSSMGNAPLEKSGTDVFTMTTYNGTVTFTRNEAKRINGIKIEVMGMLLEGTKEEKEVSVLTPVIGLPKTTFPMKFLPALLIQEDEGLSN